MSFTQNIKNEICLNNYTEDENFYLLCGFLRNNSIIKEDSIKILSENPKVIRKIFVILKEFSSDIEIAQGKGNNFNKKSYYNIIIKDRISFIESKFFLNTKPTIKEELNKRAYLRGAFLSCGSINDPKKSRYHLEFLTDSKEEATFIMELLESFYINAKVIPRDKGYMTYVKEAEKIGDFLRVISATNAILYYEDIRIYRDHKNMTNRLNNCEQANVDKIIKTNAKQLEDIEIIKENIGLDLIDEKLKEVIVYREKYPEVSLSDLSYIITKETGKKLSKSGLNHRFARIKELASKYRS